MVNHFYSMIFLFLFAFNIASIGQIVHETKKDSNQLLKNDQSPQDLKFITLCTNLKFPLAAITKNIYEGYVYFKFQVNDCGRIINIEPTKYSDELFIKYAKEYLDQIFIDVDTIQEGLYYNIKISFKVE